jgi:small subunit ribosomal protein S8
LVFVDFVSGNMLIKVRSLVLKKQVGNMAKTNYPVGDFLIRLKNAALARQREVEVNITKLIKAVAVVLKEEGYLESMKEKSGKLIVRLAYRRKKPVFINLKLVSKPGLRIYQSADDLASKKGPSFFVLSTPKGLMSSRQAIKKRLGGEVIVEVL